jgi:nonsense-mediated mRNA decay protein 3
MKQKFCPKCGNPIEKFYENICRNCFLSKISLMDKLPDTIKIRQCKRCGRFIVDKKMAETIEQATELTLADLLNQPEVYSANYRIQNNKIHVSIKLKVDDLEKSEEKTLALNLRRINCEHCSMQNDGYYQAIIQLRAPEKKFDSLAKELRNYITKLNRKTPSIFISNEERVSNGTDFYISSKSAAASTAKYFSSRHKTKIKITRKLSGTISGKTSYKDTILIIIE